MAESLYMRRPQPIGVKTKLLYNRKVSIHKATAVHKPLCARVPDAFAELKSTWWKDGVIYQIYIPSFKDCDGDGYGDFNGVLEKLDYLVGLGVNILWLSPIFDSPMHDMGYDISDYYRVNPLYGEMADFDRLLEQAHERGLKVILDIALNHSSSENEWFKKSVRAHAGEQNEYKDYYIWGDPLTGEDGKKMPPSNWESTFGGPMWEYVPEINKYYLHVFGQTQPDLNWESPQVRQTLWKVLRFWLDKGVDGFRLDAINCTSKLHNEDLNPNRPGKPTASGWPDAPITDDSKVEQKADHMFANGPKAHEWLHEMYTEVFSHYDALSLGEMSCGINPEIGPDFISRDESQRQLDLILHFEHVELDCVNGDKWVLRDWKLPELKRAVTKWQTRMVEVGGWDTVWMENHDQPRGLGRFFKDNTGKISRDQAAKLLAVWLFTLQGTVIIFQGQELGMTNPQEFSEAMVRDIETSVYWNAAHAPGSEGDEKKLEMVKRVIMTKGRDTARIPIPWNTDDKTSAGFTGIEAKPWLPHHPHFRELSAETQTQNPDSIWTFYHAMIRMRKQHPVLAFGVYDVVDEEHLSIFAYTRTHGRDIYLVVLNFSTEPVEWGLPPQEHIRDWTVVISTSGCTKSDRKSPAKMMLDPYEGIVFRRQKIQLASCGCDQLVDAA